MVHARGFGAHGYFENYESLADITEADLFQRPKEKTPVFVRFSTVAGNKGSPEPAARDLVADAFAYMKFIGHTPAAVGSVRKGRAAGKSRSRIHHDKRRKRLLGLRYGVPQGSLLGSPHRLAPERIITIINAGLNPARGK